VDLRKNKRERSDCTKYIIRPYCGNREAIYVTCFVHNQVFFIIVLTVAVCSGERRPATWMLIAPKPKSHSGNRQNPQKHLKHHHQTSRRSNTTQNAMQRTPYAKNKKKRLQNTTSRRNQRRRQRDAMNPNSSNGNTFSGNPVNGVNGTTILGGHAPTNRVAETENSQGNPETPKTTRQHFAV
jgi:hypothetical protein